MNPDQFVRDLHHKGIFLDNKQIEQFSTYYQLLIEWNEKVNLTSITNMEDVYLKHFYDSITAAFYYDFTKKQSLCDIGAGAGFPSIPLKICFPNLNVTIVDSLQKRINFLDHLVSSLGLANVTLYHDRAENFGKNSSFRENFDIVTARAVARMSVLSELCLPLVKKDGVFIAMKGANAKQEMSHSQKAIETMGGNQEASHTFVLPEEESERSIILITKQGKTPKKYPRKAGTPNKNPIE